MSERAYIVHYVLCNSIKYFGSAIQSGPFRPGQWTQIPCKNQKNNSFALLANASPESYEKKNHNHNHAYPNAYGKVWFDVCITINSVKNKNYNVCIFRSKYIFFFISSHECWYYLKGKYCITGKQRIILTENLFQRPVFASIIMYMYVYDVCSIATIMSIFLREIYLIVFTWKWSCSNQFGLSITSYLIDHFRPNV